MYKIDVGCYRTDSRWAMQIISGYIGNEKVHYEAPPASCVENEMIALLQYANHDDQTDYLIKATIIHLWFASIHPFEDGNGRIARALTEIFQQKVTIVNLDFTLCPLRS